MIKIYVPPIEKFDLQKNKGEINHVIKDGVNLNKKTELVNTPEESDFIFLDFRHLNGRSGYNNQIPKKWLYKTVIIDYKDDQNLFDIECLHYFKRSVVGTNGKFIDYKKNVHPISYAVKNNCLEHNKEKYIDRKIDISVFLRRPHQRIKPDMTNREIVAEFISKKFKNKNIFVGISGIDGEAGRMDEDNQSYYETMLNSKIVVTCNPDKWEGDYRLFEALSCGPMVMVDSMITPVKNPFVNKKHLIYYNSLTELENEINYYLNNEEERNRIANEGYSHTLTYHKSSDRIDEILEIIL